MLDMRVAQEIADRISEAVGHNVLLTDAQGWVIGSGDPERVGTFHEASVPVIRRREVAWHDAKAARPLTGVQPGITLPLVIGKAAVGSVGITGDPAVVRPFGEIVRRQTEILIRETSLLRLGLLRERALEQLLQDIASFDGDPRDAAAIGLRAEELGFRLDLPRAPVVLEVPHDARDAATAGDRAVDRQSRKYDLLRAVRDVFSNQQDLVTSVGTDAIVVLWDVGPGTSEDGTLRERLVERCQHAVDDLEHRWEAQTSAGLGAIAANLGALAQSYRDAWNALRLGVLLQPGRRIFHAQEFRLRQILLNVEARAGAAYQESLLGALRAERNWPEVRNTLVAWCENGFRLIDTANALHIHRNTLVYRLTKIGELGGLDAREPQTALALYVACLLEEMGDTGHPPMSS